MWLSKFLWRLIILYFHNFNNYYSTNNNGINNNGISNNGYNNRVYRKLNGKLNGNDNGKYNGSLKWKRNRSNWFIAAVDSLCNRNCSDSSSVISSILLLIIW